MRIATGNVHTVGYPAAAAICYVIICIRSYLRRAPSFTYTKMRGLTRFIDCDTMGQDLAAHWRGIDGWMD